ncbi:MAG: chitobiase/beta-hexosaminidase C-terminal domain-containing protein, partial [Muribaculaceae bacterium]|nr:chitobiase/beta-hexosaminidase C-terminal domain-containing protein [Muribaculaceae bacterium]
MRKFLSLVMMAMFAVGAWAADETVVFSEQGYANQEEVTSYSGTDFTVTFDKGTNSNTPKYYNTGAAIRVYGGGYFTVSSSTKTIAKIEVGFASGEGTNAITTDVETYSDGTWTGSASSVKFTVGGTSGHRRIASIAVTYAGGDTPVQTVTPPTFSPAAGEVKAGTAVTISAPDAEMIIYTTDGTTPSYANSVGEIYEEPIVVNEAMTIKAIAVDANENESAVATAAYTIKPQAVNVATVAEFNALPNNTVFTFTGSLVATGQTGKYLFAQDSEKGILIYGNIGQTYSDLAVIPGGWTGKKTTFNGAPEAANPAGLAAATDHADLAPEEMTPAQVT